MAFLPGKPHVHRSLEGYSPWGHKEPNTTEPLTRCLWSKWFLMVKFHTHKHLVRSHSLKWLIKYNPWSKGVCIMGTLEVMPMRLFWERVSSLQHGTLKSRGAHICSLPSPGGSSNYSLLLLCGLLRGLPPLKRGPPLLPGKHRVSWPILFWWGWWWHSLSWFYMLDFPDGSNGKESACKCKRPKFNPRVRKIPCRREWQPTPVCIAKKTFWNIINTVVIAHKN